MILRRICLSLFFFGSLIIFTALALSGKVASATKAEQLRRLPGALSATHPPLSPTAGTPLKVLSWNVAFGKGTDAVKNFDRTAVWIARVNPDLAGLCEIPPDDVPVLLSYLSQRSGQLWYSHFVPKFNGVLEGNLILSKYPFVSVNGFFLSYGRSVAHATVNIGGTNINFFATHLDDGSSGARYAQVVELTNWAGNFSGPKVFAGDFNGGPDTSEAVRMMNSYSDAWSQALSTGTAHSYADNPLGMHTRTRRGRIDYVFHSVDFLVSSASIPDTRDLSNPNVVVRLGTLDDRGVRPSDHNQMIAELVLAGTSPIGTPTPTPQPTPTPTSPPGSSGTLQFNSGTHVFNEGSLVATIVVNRTGDTTHAATIEYLSEDGSAQQRTDYTTAAGTLRFNPGESSKSITLLINDDLYAEGNETLYLKLKNPTGGATLGTPTTTSLTLADNDSGGASSNPLDDPTWFVRQHYHDFLSRQADQSGLLYWVSQLIQCGSITSCFNNRRVAVSDAFFFEPEFQKTAAYVFRLYRLAYGNNQPNPNPDSSNPSEARKIPSYATFVADRAKVVDGSDLTRSQIDLANEFVQREEFRARYSTSLNPADFVAAVLATISNSSGVDLSSQAAALTAICHDQGRGAVLYRLAEDNLQGNPIDNRGFIDAEYNRSFVMAEYAAFLRRDSDIAGYLFWLEQVNGAPLRDATVQHSMVCSFITSREFQERFSPIVTRSNSECGQ